MKNVKIVSLILCIGLIFGSIGSIFTIVEGASNGEKTFTHIETLEEAENLVDICRYNPNGSILAISSSNNTYIYNTTTWTNEAKLDTPNDKVTDLTYNPSGSMLAIGSSDGNAYIYNTSDWLNPRILSDATNNVTSIDFSPNGGNISVGSVDSNVYIYNISSWSNTNILNDPTDEVNTAVFSPNGDYFAVGSQDNDTYVYNANTWNYIDTLTYEESYITAMTFSHDSSYLAVGSNDTDVSIYDTSDWTITQQILDGTDWISSVDFSSDDNYFLLSSSSATRVYDVSTWASEADLTDPVSTIEKAMFSKSDEFVAVGSWDDNVYIYNTSDWSNTFTLDNSTGPIFALDLSTEHLASGSSDYNTYIYDIYTETIINPPNSVSVENPTKTSLDLSWTKSADGEYVYIERNTTQSWSRGDGFEVYNNTGTSTTDDSLDSATKYYYQFWTYNDTLNQYSSSYANDNGITLGTGNESGISVSYDSKLSSSYPHPADNIDGKKKWNKALDGYNQTFEGSYSGIDQISPLYDNGTLYIRGNKTQTPTLYFVNATTGIIQQEVLLTTATSSKLNSPYIKGDTIYITNRTGGVFAIDKETGNILWSDDVGGVGETFITSTMVGNDVYIGSNTTGNLYAVNDGGVNWTYTAPSVINYTVSIYNDYLYLGSQGGYLSKIDMGGNEIWSYKYANKTPSYPIVSEKNEIVIALGENESTTIDGHHPEYNALDLNGNMIWQNRSYPTPDGFRPALSPDGHTFYSTEYYNGIVAFNVTTGKREFKTILENSYVGNPSVSSDGSIFIPSYDGIVRLDDNGDIMYSFDNSDYGYGDMYHPTIGPNKTMYSMCEDGTTVAISYEKPEIFDGSDTKLYEYFDYNAEAGVIDNNDVTDVRFVYETKTTSGNISMPETSTNIYSTSVTVPEDDEWINYSIKAVDTFNNWNSTDNKNVSQVPVQSQEAWPQGLHDMGSNSQSQYSPTPSSTIDYEKTITTKGYFTSGLTIAGDVAYTTANNSLRAHQTNDGSVLWRYDAPLENAHIVDSAPISSDDESIILADNRSNVICLDSETGNKQWDVTLDARYDPLDTTNDTTITTGYGYAYVMCDEGGIAKIDVSTGYTVWTTSIPTINTPFKAVLDYNTSVDLNHNGLFVAEPNGLHKINQSDGNIIWTVNTFEMGGFTGPPTLRDDELYIPFAGGIGMESINIYTNLTSNTEAQYISGPAITSPVKTVSTYEDRFYALSSGNDALYCYNDSGEIWSYTYGTKFGSAVTSPVLDSNGNVYLGIENAVISLNKDGSEEWIVTLNNQINNRIALGQDSLYGIKNSTTESQLFRLMGFQGPEIESHSPLDGEVKTSEEIRIKFNKEMNITSIKENFKYEDDENTYNISDVKFTWQSSYNVASFDPKEGFEQKQTYKVTLDTSTKDTEGNSLQDDHTWNFTVYDFTLPTVNISVEPEKMSANIDTDVVIEFSEPMNKSSVNDSLSISLKRESGWSIFLNQKNPMPNYEKNWTSNSTLIIGFNDTLLPSSTYQVKITAEVEDLYGNKLDGNMNNESEGVPEDDYIYSFRTEWMIPPWVVGIPMIALIVYVLKWAFNVSFKDLSKSSGGEKE